MGNVPPTSPVEQSQILRVLTASVELAESRVTANGYLVVPAVLARSGVIDWGPGQRELWPEEVLAAGLADWSVMSLTTGHPTDWDGSMVVVTSANARYYAVGHVAGQAVMRDGLLHAMLVLTDQTAIDAVRAGQKQLSIGALVDRAYRLTKLAEYEITKVIPNHVALVAAGACGAQCAIGLHVHSAHSVHRAPQLQELKMACTCNTDLAGLQARLTASEAAHQTERARAETALAQLTAERAGAAARVDARIALLSDARRVIGESYAPTAGTSDLAVLADVTAHVLPSMAPAVREAATAGNEAFVRAAHTAALAGLQAARNAPIVSAAQQVAAAGATPAVLAAATGQPPTLESMRLELVRKQARLG